MRFADKAVCILGTHLIGPYGLNTDYTCCLLWWKSLHWNAIILCFRPPFPTILLSRNSP